MPVLPEEIESALAEPFDPAELKFKPSVVSNDKKRALAMAYIDARHVQERLDEVVGVANWSDDYTTEPGGSVVCRLRVRIAGEWIQKSDVGSPSEQPDDGDKLKAAFSDALKRAAVKFGVGRYLYRLPASWCDYDAQGRKLAANPTLPEWAIPSANRPCGPEWSDKVMKLATQAAEMSGKKADIILNTAINGYKYPAGTTVASIHLHHAKDLTKRLGAWIAELSTGRGKTQAA